MGILTRIRNKNIEKKKVINETCEAYISQIDKALNEIQELFEDRMNYIDLNKRLEWRERNICLIHDLDSQNIKKINKANNFKKLIDKKYELKHSEEKLKYKILSHNEQVAELRIEYANEIIGKIEGRVLDKQQMLCIVKDAHNHLVVAGAGTGKTTTVIGKIKFLLGASICNPEDILVLSFTNASAKEMSQRINSETGCQIEASTFHKLGLNIITKVNGTIPKITKINLKKFIKEQLLLNMQNFEYLSMLSSYLLFNRVVSKSEFDFHSQEELEEYLKLNPPITINNETVKSYGEMEIANFLNQYSIKYVYEHPYKKDTRTEKYAQYYPDFYLPDYDVYIEYFAIDRKGEVPPYFEGKDALNATEAYRVSMEWKREIHRNNNTRMIECYAYEKFENNLLEKLKQKLIDCDVEMRPKTAEELWENVIKNDTSVLEGLIELFQTIINLVKSSGYTISRVRTLNSDVRNMARNEMILFLIEPIYHAYDSYLKNSQEIDFNDMINMASQYVEEKKYINSYKYVIVDEYQDISKSRYNLLMNMRKSRDYDLFCVGDDWQSIYRFAGSDIGYILNFEKHWGEAEISKIETTYRFSKQLIEISGNFIMRNPAQIKKSIKGRNDQASFPLGEINGYTEKYAIDFMIKRLDDLPKNSSVFFIGRYTFDIGLLNENVLLDCNYDNVQGIVNITYRKRKDLKMCFITAHKAKGLQADYVFIINNKKSKMGFPSKIQEAPILSLLLDDTEQFMYAEERRLFYVALTRAKQKVFIVTVNGNESEFSLELKTRYAKELTREQFECPLCGGVLTKKAGTYGEFLGCSNYKSKGCRYTRNITKKEKI